MGVHSPFWTRNFSPHVRGDVDSTWSSRSYGLFRCSTSTTHTGRLARSLTIVSNRLIHNIHKQFQKLTNIGQYIFFLEYDTFCGQFEIIFSLVFRGVSRCTQGYFTVHTASTMAVRNQAVTQEPRNPGAFPRSAFEKDRKNWSSAAKGFFPKY